MLLLLHGLHGLLLLLDKTFLLGKLLLKVLIRLLKLFQRQSSLAALFLPFASTQPGRLSVFQQTVLFGREVLAQGDDLGFGDHFDVEGEVSTSHNVGVLIIDL